LNTTAHDPRSAHLVAEERGRRHEPPFLPAPLHRKGGCERATRRVHLGLRALDRPRVVPALEVALRDARPSVRAGARVREAGRKDGARQETTLRAGAGRPHLPSAKPPQPRCPVTRVQATPGSHVHTAVPQKVTARARKSVAVNMQQVWIAGGGHDRQWPQPRRYELSGLRHGHEDQHRGSVTACGAASLRPLRQRVAGAGVTHARGAMQLWLPHAPPCVRAARSSSSPWSSRARARPSRRPRRRNPPAGEILWVVRGPAVCAVVT